MLRLNLTQGIGAGLHVLVPTLLLLASAPVAAEHAHEHGVASMEVALDGRTLAINLESPLDNMVGFEHAPRNARQQAALKRLSDELEGYERLFDLPDGAACRLVRAESRHPYQASANAAAGSHDADEAGHDDAHAELHATWEFDCTRPEALNGIGLRLFDVFPGIKRVRAQTVTPAGQGAANLNPTNRQLRL